MSQTQKPAAPAVRWRWDDSLLQFFAPKTARNRYSERVAAAILRRGYDAAAKGRGTSGWRATSTSADAEIGAASALLRDRMRDLVRNDPMAAAAVQVLVNNMVGTGIRPRAKSGNKALDKKADKLWAEWTKECDAHGHTDFHGLLALAVREMIEGGDLFALRRRQPSSSRMGVPLKIELREADHLDAARVRSESGDLGRIDQGIEYDRTGRRTAYWMFPDHPGSRSPVFTRSLESVRMPAEGVAHLFERQRVQSRGTPWGVPAMRGLRDFGDWHHAELVRKKTEACFVGVVLDDGDGAVAPDGEAGLAGKVTDASGQVVEEWSPGLFAYSHGGRDVKFHQPSAAGGVQEWNRAQLHIIAAGFRVPYSLMTGDLSQANFSSSRVGLNEFRRMVEQIQWQTIIPMICEPIWRWFIEAAQLAGKLPEDRMIAAEWAPPRFEAVNPLQDTQADLLEVRAGFATRSQKIAARGYDPAEVTEEWKADADAADAAKLIFDSDPRKVTKVGVAQGDKTDPPDPPQDGGS